MESTYALEISCREGRITLCISLEESVVENSYSCGQCDESMLRCNGRRRWFGAPNANTRRVLAQYSNGGSAYCLTLSASVREQCDHKNAQRHRSYKQALLLSRRSTRVVAKLMILCGRNLPPVKHLRSWPSLRGKV